MRKIVRLYRRSPGSDVEVFHQRLAATCKGDPDVPGLWRYVQSHTLLGGYRKGELLFDAVEEFLFPTPDLASDTLRSPTFRNLCDRRAPLIDPEQSLTMEVDLHRVKNRPVPANAVKNIEFVNRRPQMALTEFRRYWRDVHGPIGAQIPTILRYEQNHSAPTSYGNGATPRFDGLAITWFESTAAMRAGAATPEYERTRQDEANFLPDGHLPIIITREVLAI